MQKAAAMKIAVIGGGPAGLYFALLMKRASASHEVEVFERHRAGDTFGFGVVFSDQTMSYLAEADPQSYEAITKTLAHWDDIDTHIHGQVVRSTGHGFSGLSRQTLLNILTQRCRDVDVDLHFEREVSPDVSQFGDADLIVVCDGVNSALRDKYQDRFEPEVDFRPNRFVWLGTDFPFKAFTFYFNQNEHGLFRVHAYRYEKETSTFIVECTEQTWKAAGLDKASEDETIAYCEKLFAKELAGHKLLKNRSIWRQFPTVKNRNWHFDNVVLLGDAVHTAHFSIGSGTKLAMEDAIALRDAVVAHDDVSVALDAYERERRGVVESLQRAAQVSLEWFENTERYLKLPALEFTFSMLTRSLRVTHENLRLRDPELIARVDQAVAAKAAKQSGVDFPQQRPPPPLLTPYKLRDLVLDNRIVVSPMCMYSAEDGTVNDWHLVHLGSRAVGGAGLVIAEMTNVSADGRISPGCAGMYSPEHVTAWKRITDFVHQYTSARIGLQLGHAGRKGATKRLWDGPDEPLEDGAWPLLSASAIPYLPNSQTPKPMTEDDMRRVVADHVRAAEMAERAGFDLLELHCAHGYLLSSFLSPLTNQRTDAYGGAVQARLKFPLQVFEAVRKAWPAHKPMSVRISASDWAPGGISPEDAVVIGRTFHEHGADIIDVSAGQTVPDQKPTYGRLFQTPLSEFIRLEAGVPTMTVGNIQSFSDANSIVAAQRADLCVIARGHLHDPYWTRHAAGELGQPPSWPRQYRAIEKYNFRFS